MCPVYGMYPVVSSKAVSPLSEKNRRHYTNPKVVVNQSGELELKENKASGGNPW